MGRGRAGDGARFPGNLGATLLHPGPGSSEYHLVYRFEDDESLAAWERSSERRSALAHVEDMVDDERYARVAGLESFFTRPAAARTALADDGADDRGRLRDHVDAAAVRDAAPGRGGRWSCGCSLSAVLVVLLLGHVLMPALTRPFAAWLHPRRD